MEFSLQTSDPTVTYWKSLRQVSQQVLQQDYQLLTHHGSPPRFDASLEERPSVEDRQEEAPCPFKDLLDNVSSVLKDKDIFVIGGHVHDDTTGGDTTGGDTTSTKVAIRWEGYPNTLRLPLADDQDSFNTLLNVPATTGVNNFLTDFNLAAYGILETINQTLVQSKHSAKKGFAVKAELCKLDVFSAHSGTSQQLVNNPDLSRQVGSLVVCLPVAHKGGQLAFRHDGQQVEFDWASQHPETIQWAAFLNACEHEVLPITEGHRVMLTYNLVWANWSHGFLGAKSKMLDQESAYFYTDLEKLFEKMKSTGEYHVVGFTCTRRYLHTSRSSSKQIRHMLKGIDMVVYQALDRLADGVNVGAVLDDSDYVESQLEMKQMELERLEKLAKNPDAHGRSSPYEYDDSDFENTVCLTGQLSRAWTTDWYRSYDDPYVPDPVEHLDGYGREKVHWLNYAPDKKTPKELAVAIYSVAESEPQCQSLYSSVTIFAWAN